MLAELQALGRSSPLPPIEVVDVDADPVLERRHGLDVPVLLLDGTVVCRHRLDCRARSACCDRSHFSAFPADTP